MEMEISDGIFFSKPPRNIMTLLESWVTAVLWQVLPSVDSTDD